MLHECKRLKSDEDRQKLHDMKKMLLTDKEPLLNVIEKHFGWSEGNEISEHNIAFTNNTCKKVSKKIRLVKGIKDEHIFGEEVDAESCSRQTIESSKEQP